MILYPAIDIRGGQAVRLLQGDYDRETAYDADPVDAARRWADDGAEFLHVVDLDGAKAGSPQNLEAVRRIAAAVECPIQVGGGLRDPRSLDAVLEAGAARVVIGTAALRDPDFLDRALEAARRPTSSSRSTPGPARSRSRAGPRAADGEAPEVAAELGERGVRRFLYTSIDVDGTMEGPAIDELNGVAEAAAAAQVIASGGVGTLADLELLARVARPQRRGRDRRPGAVRAPLQRRRGNCCARLDRLNQTL